MMHDPSYLAWEFHAPIPVLDRWRTRMCREGRGRPEPFVARRTNAENRGERTYPWWHLKGYRPHVGPWCFQFPRIVEVWHDEPGGAEMGTVCEYRDRGERPIGWTIEHRRHLRWKLVPYVRVSRWMFDRCDECGKRFGWREARFGVGWYAKGVLHDKCHGYRHMRHRVADLAKYVRGEANETERWRIRYEWLGDDDTPGRAVSYFRDLGVGRSDLTADNFNVDQ